MEDMSVVTLLFNQCGRVSARRALSVWAQFEREFRAAARDGRADARALILIHPDDAIVTLNAALRLHPRFAGRHDCQDRETKFIACYGYRRTLLDTPARTLVYILDEITTVQPPKLDPLVFQEEMKTRRRILVSAIRAFHAADAAWILPGMIVFRSKDSPDCGGEDGVVVRQELRENILKLWSPSDFGDREWVDQAFREGTANRRTGGCQWRRPSLGRGPNP